MSSTALRGSDRVLDFADRWRRLGGGASGPMRLYHECVEAFRRGEISFDDVTPLYRHGMIHAGAINPRNGTRYETCPTCGCELDWPDD